MTRLFSGLAAALLMQTTATFAHDYKIDGISVDHPMTFELPASAKAAGGYMTITNTGADDRLVAVEGDFPRIMLHESIEKDGVARMEHRHAIDLPSGKTVKLAPGGLHVMFIGLDGIAFVEGEKIPVTLVFEKAGKLDVMFNVEKRGAAAHDHTDHSGHGDHDAHKDH